MNDAQREAAEKFEMPMLRHFKVTQLSPETNKLATELVHAHAMDWDKDGVAVFMDFTIREDVGVSSAIHRVLYRVYAVEEVQRTPSLEMIPKSTIFH